MNGGKSVCGRVYPGGALSFTAPKGKFEGKISLEMWLKTDERVPEIDVNLSGDGVRYLLLALCGLAVLQNVPACSCMLFI